MKHFLFLFLFTQLIGFSQQSPNFFNTNYAVYTIPVSHISQTHHSGNQQISSSSIWYKFTWSKKRVKVKDSSSIVSLQQRKSSNKKTSKKKATAESYQNSKFPDKKTFEYDRIGYLTDYMRYRKSYQVRNLCSRVFYSPDNPEIPITDGIINQAVLETIRPTIDPFCIPNQ